MIGEFIFIGVISGLLGLLYRNFLKGSNMVFNSLYSILDNWVHQAEYCREYPKTAQREEFNTRLQGFLGAIACPLGYCIYCSTPWISALLYTLYISSWADLPSWQWLLIGLITVVAVSHLIVVGACKWILPNHPDFDE